MHAWWMARGHAVLSSPTPPDVDFGEQTPFVPQKLIVTRRLKMAAVAAGGTVVLAAIALVAYLML
jgi:hypothetical protein